MAASSKPALRSVGGLLAALPEALLAAVYRHLPVRELSRLMAAGRSTQVRAALALLWDPPTGDEGWLDVHALGVRGPHVGMAVIGRLLLLLDQNGYMRGGNIPLLRHLGFHRGCLERWAKEENTCPCCKKEFPRLPAPRRMRQVAALDRRWLMLDVRGGVWSCWPEDAPVPVEGMPAAVRSLSASHTHCLLLTASGEVFRCGHDLRPQRVAGLPPVRQVAVGVAVSFFLDRSGRVWSCGSNENGQLLRPHETVVYQVPLQVPLPIASPVVQLAAAAGNVATVHADGTLCCGGRRSVHPHSIHLGYGVYEHRLAVCSSGVAGVEVSRQHTVVRKTDGSVWTAGSGPADGKLWRVQLGAQPVCAVFGRPRPPCAAARLRPVPRPCLDAAPAAERGRAVGRKRAGLCCGAGVNEW